MIYANLGSTDSIVNFKATYENFVGEQWGASVKGNYFDNITPVTGEVICRIPRSSAVWCKTWDNGKPVRETLAAYLPLSSDHFRYYAGCIRPQESTLSKIDNDTVAYHFHESLIYCHWVY